ncbi:TylF/MycF/NovP-related O-methyltransferase [Streptomyces albireticuli]|nr:TylF/MycF/NovP-related O-methyltransferase [Streptomyces albireticuli]MCD9141561.1 TylF/MycF family methyltransferase [Streptomyces albireticuli]MCD9164188.1 TylF/MycF family methyltransferase [Streptomyces albireticuli]MCD9189735.1 TylF/MycF family methyltransferase [Streptomyces albireticuli]
MGDERAALRAALLYEQPRTVNRGRMEIVEAQLVGVLERGIVGAVVELGCFRGAMTAWMRAVIDAHDSRRPDKEVHTFDAFEGLPPPGPYDSGYLRTGEFTGAVGDVLVLHDRFGLARPHIHAGWLADTLPHGLPERIAFAYLDADRYDSTLTGLKACVPRLAPGAVLVLDDYADPCAVPGGEITAQPKAPGVLAACREYFGEARLPRVVSTAAAGSLGLGLHRADDVNLPRPGRAPGQPRTDREEPAR